MSSSAQSSRTSLWRLLRTCWIVGAVARPRYLALTLAPFLAGELWSDAHNPVYLVLGTIQILLLRIVSSVGNCVSDQVEDARDHPRRVGYCLEVGYDNLLRVVQAAGMLFVAILIYMVSVIHITLLATGLWTAFFLLKVAYSFGPRLKPRKYVATFLLGSLSWGMFITGWFGLAIRWDNAVALAVLLMWVGGTSLGGSKDAPNLGGDADIGYESPIIRVMKRTQPIWLTTIIVCLPFVLSSALALFTEDDALFIPLLSAPVGLLFLRILLNAKTAIDRELIRELGYLYWIAFMGSLLVALSSARTETLLVMVSATAWYVVATWILHPDDTALTYDGLRRGLAIAFGQAR